MRPRACLTAWGLILSQHCPYIGARVEYRSASRIGESDGDVNRKRIRAIRQQLEKKGWRSTGF